MTRVAIVTGAAGGIGSAICDLLEQQNWSVVAVDIVPIDRPGSLRLDVADPSAVLSELGAVRPLHALVNNAAVQLFVPLSEITIDAWDHVQAVNLRGPFVCMQACLPSLLKSRGSVVNVGSVHAHATSSSIAAYAASKGGLSALTRAAALELAPAGVRVNAVLPGAVDTPALQDGLFRIPEARTRLIERTPLGRVGTAVDIAHAVAFFLDDTRAGFATGQELVVDGGALARLSTE